MTFKLCPFLLIVHPSAQIIVQKVCSAHVITLLKNLQSQFANYQIECKYPHLALGLGDEALAYPIHLHSFHMLF